MPSSPSGSGPLGVLMAAIKEAVRGEVATALGSLGVRPSGGIAAVPGGGTTPSGGGVSLLVRSWLQLELLLWGFGVPRGEGLVGSA